MESYFRLAEQFRTQDEPAFCGLSTLTMVLNALAVDPGRVWKGTLMVRRVMPLRSRVCLVDHDKTYLGTK